MTWTIKTNRRLVYGLVGFAVTVFCSVFASSPRSTGKEGPRPITSLTIQQRMNLPANTQVQLRGGRITTLGVLREEHQRRMQRFANTEVLARAARGKMPPITPQKSSKAAPQPKQSGKPSVVTWPTPPAKSPGPHPLVLDANPGLSMVPNQFITHSGYPLPRDYVAACANSTACLYLPARTYLVYAGALAMDFDAMLVDPGLCASDGGLMALDGSSCFFSYPLIVSETFQLARKQSTTGRCDPPMRFSQDPAEVVKIWYDAPDNPGFFVSQDDLTCVVQVWQAR